MKIKKILPNRPVTIEYRTFTPYGNDILEGYARWNGKELISLDGDAWNINDEIGDYYLYDGDEMVVWYESKWIIG
jgi:hypothetical protein